jgi:bifunctional non-homologous end joining protein LigD
MCQRWAQTHTSPLWLGRIRIPEGLSYLTRMLRKLEYLPRIPTCGTEVPSGPDWFHEIKHDGYRLIVQREGKRVRLLTGRGYDWSDRYPLITQAALRLRKSSFVIDGEAVVLGPDGISDFAALYSGRRNAEVRLYAFDLLSDDGVDMRDETLQIRKLWLGKLLKRSTGAIILNEHEAGEIGPALFRQACKMGLGGIVSKHRESSYRSGHARTGSRSKIRSRGDF